MTGQLFVYKNVCVNEDRKSVSFDYEIFTDEKKFSITEELEFPKSLPSSSVVDRLLKAMHLALGISYYKTFLPPVVDHAYFMDAEEAEFWNIIFEKGLGEFLYNNKLTAEKLAKFSSQTGTIKPGSQDDISWNDSALLGIGGGKDSIVAGELLKESGISINGFVLATGDNEGQSRAVADKMNVDLMTIKRKIDPQIIELNKMDGALNGHVPVSFIFALAGCLLATTNGNKYVVVANEASASIPQINNVNHQWSKSYEFEKMFQAYVHGYISPELHYFSAVRPLSSIAVAKIFAKHPNYFEVFTSDNSHFKIGNQNSQRWTLESPKSLSSYILLAPWLDDESLNRIFSRNFLDIESLGNEFLGLLGVEGNPVLDCVGTPEELLLSLSHLISQDRMKNCSLVKMALEKGIIKQESSEELQKMLSIENEHAIPTPVAIKYLPKMKEQLT